MTEGERSDGVPDPLAELLAASRPRPDAGWVRATERGVFTAVRRRRRAERRTVFGAGLGLAATLLVVTLAGGGPLAIDGGAPATAKPGCKAVYETRVESVGEVVQQDGGAVVVRSTKRPVQRQINRCR